jgi:cell division protein FtsW
MGLHRLLLFMAVASIFALGLVMIFSTTSAEVLDHDLDRSTHQALVKQIYYAGVGLVLAGMIGRLGYRRFLQNSAPLLLLFSFLLLLTLIPGIGHEVNGSRRWLYVGGFSFQPSEFVKYLIPAYFIHRFLQFEGKPIQFCDFFKLIGTVLVPLGLILVEPNNGTAAVIGITLAMLCLLMQIPFKYWALPLLIFIAVGGVFAYHLPYVSARLKVYLNPELDLKGKGHQPYQAKIATGSGQLFGKGPGNSLQKLSYLPEAQNDYIAAIFAEEFGFLGMLSLIILYMTFVYQGFYIADRSQTLGGFYLAGCIAFLIGFQAFLNLGVVSGLVPSTGLNLPLFSQGGSSLIANIAGVTLLFDISRRVKAQARECRS